MAVLFFVFFFFRQTGLSLGFRCSGPFLSLVVFRFFNPEYPILVNQVDDLTIPYS